MALRIKEPIKQVELNGKLYDIPKLGINYYQRISDKTDIQQALDSIVFDIIENPSKAEYEYIILNLSAFNGLIKESKVYKGTEYFVENVKLYNHRQFKIQDKIVEPKELPAGYTPTDVFSVLNDSFDDYLELPAYAINWVDELLTSVTLELSDRTLKGLLEIQEFFDE